MTRFVWLLTACVMAASGCATTGAPAPRDTSAPAPQDPSTAQRAPATTPIDPRQAERLRTIMVPLLKAMDKPLDASQVRVGLMNDSHINAANGGGGEFYVTTGLLQKANDDQLRAVLAHEIAHADLGHVAKIQMLGAGLSVGMAILDQIIPGSGALTPIAGKLITSAYGRREEYAADAQGVAILRRAGFDGKKLMADTLQWLTQTEGEGGGFFATHPAGADRIEAVRQLK